ncbi:transporter substrate-binding domain-containing protein [Paracoccus aerius]|uniref:Transporter substrate-binding domain-containing protein n=1 Tax=Paracoccus aerius TaxID=1915382 RepID=A0ABS1S7Y1_9RHOB|nr:transporter substrate-binding domain-containing protein [Paracoccus aerius]MBL3674818.1 transporter substrate-binding domain-containing protein [Paracoccus aerius]GHG29507.1 ABC transporter substrate-binding protein [Paracoccus aerius]
MISRRSFTAFLAGSVALAALPAAAQAQSSLERIKTSGVLRIGAVADGAPYYQKSVADGSWRGFYIDICKKLAGDLGVDLEITETTWGNSVLELQADKLDVFFGLNPTPEREKVIDFSGPCFRNAFSLVVDEDEQRAAWEDFNNPETRIAVDAGSSHDSAVTRHCPDAQIVRLKSQSDATASVQAGRADAQCLVLILALTLVSKNKNIGKVVIPSPGDATTSNAGFRREEDPAWKDFVTGWIEEQRQSGFVRKAIIDNMALLGVTEEDFPEGFDI